MSETGQLDSDKLPWLEPYREPNAPRARLREVSTRTTPAKSLPPRRRAIGSSVGAGLGLFAAGALALGGYWYGRQSAPAAPGDTQASAIVTPLPPAGAERPVLTYPTIEDSAPADRAVPEVEQSVTSEPPRVVKSSRVDRSMPPPARRDRVVRSALNSKPPPPPVTAPPPPKPRVAAASPAVVAAAPAIKPQATSAPRAAGKTGQVLLLGYYASPRYADAARRRIVRRYPYLGGLPVVVAPISLGQGRGSMYALRLVARSKGDARALCKNLKGIGYGCTVI